MTFNGPHFGVTVTQHVLYVPQTRCQIAFIILPYAPPHNRRDDDDSSRSRSNPHRIDTPNSARIQPIIPF